MIDALLKGDFFFFSSRRRHTRYIGDWSSDVCSSDLNPSPVPLPGSLVVKNGSKIRALMFASIPKPVSLTASRSEEHTSELQSPMYLVCRLLLEKKKRYPWLSFDMELILRDGTLSQQ